MRAVLVTTTDPDSILIGQFIEESSKTTGLSDIDIVYLPRYHVNPNTGMLGHFGDKPDENGVWDFFDVSSVFDVSPIDDGMLRKGRLPGRLRHDTADIRRADSIVMHVGNSERVAAWNIRNRVRALNPRAEIHDGDVHAGCAPPEEAEFQGDAFESSGTREEVVSLYVDVSFRDKSRNVPGWTLKADAAVVTAAMAFSLAGQISDATYRMTPNVFTPNQRTAFTQRFVEVGLDPRVHAEADVYRLSDEATTVIRHLEAAGLRRPDLTERATSWQAAGLMKSKSEIDAYIDDFIGPFNAMTATYAAVPLTDSPGKPRADQCASS